MESYFVVRDVCSPSRYDLLLGNPATATGTYVRPERYYANRAPYRSVREALRDVPEGEACYRVYLARTDGRTGMKLLSR